MNSVKNETFLDLAGVSFFTKKPSWLENLDFSVSDEKKSNQDHGLDYFYHYIHHAHHFTKNKVSVHIEYIVEIVSKSGQESQTDHIFHFNPEYQEIEIHDLCVIDQDDNRIRTPKEDFKCYPNYNNSESKTLSSGWCVQPIISGLQTGCKVLVSYTRHIDITHCGYIYSCDYGPFRKDCKNYTVHCILADDYSKEQFQFVSQFTHKTHKKNNSLVHQWWIPFEEYPVFEEAAPHLYEIEEHLHFSNVQKWHQIGNWIHNETKDFNLDHCVFPSALQKIIDQAATTEKTQLVDLIVSWVKLNINYFSIPFNVSGYIPRNSKLTFDKRWGDCKDQSILLLTLLKIVHIKSRLVLLNTNHKLKAPDPIPGFLFNHCILWIDVDEGYFVDPTNFDQRNHRCIESLSRNHVLIIGDQDTEYRRVKHTPYLNYEQKTTLQIDVSNHSEPKLKVENLYKYVASGGMIETIETNLSGLKTAQWDFVSEHFEEKPDNLS
ncbi:DUF3857 domain-containing protein, partial [bacterium]|nr:DUF3857 domain-containing protein [bacterium]